MNTVYISIEVSGTNRNDTKILSEEKETDEKSIYLYIYCSVAARYLYFHRHNDVYMALTGSPKQWLQSELCILICWCWSRLLLSRRSTYGNDKQARIIYAKQKQITQIIWMKDVKIFCRRWHTLSCLLWYLCAQSADAQGRKWKYWKNIDKCAIHFIPINMLKFMWEIPRNKFRFMGKFIITSRNIILWATADNVT